jgi:hypothetical protein
MGHKFFREAEEVLLLFCLRNTGIYQIIRTFSDYFPGSCGKVKKEIYS